jgi:hypothetical protein
MTDATGHSLGVLVRAYLGRADHTALDSGCHLHMEPCGRFEAPLAENGHGRRTLRRNCLVHRVPLAASCDPGHNKTAAGADLPGSSPASIPLQSPHFLVVVKRADCAVYNARSGL